MKDCEDRKNYEECERAPRQCEKWEQRKARLQGYYFGAMSVIAREEPFMQHILLVIACTTMQAMIEKWYEEDALAISTARESEVER